MSILEPLQLLELIVTPVTPSRNLKQEPLLSINSTRVMTLLSEVSGVSVLYHSSRGEPITTPNPLAPIYSPALEILLFIS